MEKSTKWIAWTIWLIAMAWGVFGVSQRLLHGELQANYGSYIPWGLWVAGKVYLVGLGVGASLFAWIVYAFNLKRYFLLARQALLVSAIALMMGMARDCIRPGPHLARLRTFVPPSIYLAARLGDVADCHQSAVCHPGVLSGRRLQNGARLAAYPRLDRDIPGDCIFRLQRCGIRCAHRPSLLELHPGTDPFHRGGLSFRIRPGALVGCVSFRRSCWEMMPSRCPCSAGSSWA